MIPGTKRVKYLEENLGAANVVLTKEDLASVRALIKEIGVAGTRYPEAMLKLVNI